MITNEFVQQVNDILDGRSVAGQPSVQDIRSQRNKAIIEGNVKFAAAELMATDLRASVSLIIAALTTEGKSLIKRIYHLDRGYENIEKKLKKVGAKIRRVY